MYGNPQFDLFIATRSRVIRLFNLHRGGGGSAFLSSLFPAAVSLWTLKEEWGGRPSGEEDSVWVVFKSHDQATIALGMGGRAAISMVPALESDLEPFIKLRKVDLLFFKPSSSTHLRQSHSISDLRTPLYYTLSSNPPPPPPPTSNSFRHGDWICTCKAHNFMRNTLCIVCNSPRLRQPSLQLPSPPTTSPSSPPLKQLPSLVLTPSGRALSIGGKVQNISRDPMAPCIIFWPDNEPLPEQSQIRPPIQYANSHQPPPPILNTGNKGPIEQQPGDWICGKCEYLNWRRRKVCQTCYPYAEGNTDGISPTVQAERLAILAQIIGTQQHYPSISPSLSSTSTSTSASTQSPRSSPSTSIHSVVSPQSDTVPLCRHLVLPSYLTEEEEQDPSKFYYPPLVIARHPHLPPPPNTLRRQQQQQALQHPPPPPPPIRRQSSLTFTPGHDLTCTSSSIWTMKKEELDPSPAPLGLGLGLN